MPEKKEKTESVEPEVNTFFPAVKKESIKNMLKAGSILPRLKPRLDDTYEVEVLSDVFKTFESDYGKTITIDVMHKNLKKSLILPISFQTQLSARMNELGMKDFSELKGKTLVFQKTIGSTKQYKNAELYSVQIK